MYTNGVRVSYLDVLQLVEHLEVDFLDEIPREINRADPCHRAECASPDIRDLIVAEVQPSNKPHPTE
jgi:hypothetical protein